MAKNLVRIVDSNFDRVQARSGLTLKNQSQMSKLPDIREPEIPDTGREDYIHSLRELRTRYTEATRRLFNMHGIGPGRQIKRLTLALQFLEDERRNKVPYGTGKAVRAVINELTSLREGAFLDELTDDLIDLSKAQEMFGVIDKLIERSQVKKAAETEPAEDAVFDPRLAAILEQASAQTELPKLAGQSFVLAKVPVIPVASLSQPKLESRDFIVTNVGGYLMLGNQVVLGISPKQGFEEANAVRLTLRKQTKQKFVFVDERPSGHKGVLWYWMISETNFVKLASAFPNGVLKIQSWGLAV